MLFTRQLLFAPSLAACLLSGVVVADIADSRAKIAFNTLQEWYNVTSGIWNTCGWWNAANCITTIADLAKLDSSVVDTATYVFNNTYHVAPIMSNPNPGPEIENISEMNLLIPWVAKNGSQWLDSAYDDDLWWALAWIAAYDVTKRQTYLTTAQNIFSAMVSAWGTRCSNGGLLWNAGNAYISAISNELFLSTAAHLANRVPSKKSYYVSWAQKEWDWFLAQGFIGSNYTINDGLLDDCTNNGATVWSYNQGVVIGGLVELNRAAPNATYLKYAHKIARAAIETLADSNMVIHEFCEPYCAPNGAQFKGIFNRNLKMLQSDSPNDVYKAVIQNSANSIWENNRNSLNQLSVNWAGPFYEPANASTHSSAMDALVAAKSI